MSIIEELTNETKETLSEKNINKRINTLKESFEKACHAQAKRGYNKVEFALGHFNDPQASVIHAKFSDWLYREGFTVTLGSYIDKNDNEVISVCWEQKINSSTKHEVKRKILLYGDPN